jgi:Predicted Fe-S protein
LPYTGKSGNTGRQASCRVASPCVRNCCLNEDDVCLGCFRSLAEILQWSEADDPLRQRFLSNAASRRATHSIIWKR